MSQIPLATTLYTTRYLSPRILAQEKVVTCCVALVGQLRATRVYGRRQGVDWVDMSASLFQNLLLRLMQIQSSKRLNLYTRALYCFFVVRHVGTNGATRTTRATRTARRTCRDVTQQVEFGLISDDMSFAICRK